MASIKRALEWYVHATTSAAKAIREVGQADDKRMLEHSSEKLAWLEEERPNLIALVRQAAALGELTKCWELAEAVSAFLELRGYFDDWETVAKSALQAAQVANDLGIEEKALASLASVRSAQGRYGEAVEYLQRTLAIRRQVGERYAEAAALISLGSAYFGLGDLHNATDHFLASLAAFREVGGSHGESVVLSNLARVYAAEGRVGEATAALKRSIAIWHELGDYRHEGLALVRLGSLEHSSGHGDVALTHLRRALELLRAVGSPEVDDVRVMLEPLSGAIDG